MLQRFKVKRFTQDEGGAVTVDWVVLTAAVVGLAATAAVQTKKGVSTAATTITTDLSATTTGTP